MSYVRDGVIYIGSDDTTQLTSSGSAWQLVNWGDTIRVCTQRTITNSVSNGLAGEMCWDVDYIYVCTATNTWKRAALNTW